MDIEELERRVAALERAACAESEPDSEVAPMTLEEEWADVGLDGEWVHASGPRLAFLAECDGPHGSSFRVLLRHGDPVWRVVIPHLGDKFHGRTLRSALAAAREDAPDDLRRYLYPRDEWRTFGECEPEEGQWIEFLDDRRGKWRGGLVLSEDGRKSVCDPSVVWRPASPPEQKAERDEVSELRARLAEVEAERDALQDSVNAVRAIVAREGDQ